MIIRTERPLKNFTILRNSILTDDRLSFRARGIIATILSRPDDWRISSESLSKESGGREGREAIRTALKELEKFGYLVLQREKDLVNGRFNTVYYAFDISKKPVEKPVEKEKLVEKPVEKLVESDLNSVSNLPVNGLAGDGSAVSGKPVAFNKNYLTRTKREALQGKSKRYAVSKSDKINYAVIELANNWRMTN